MTGGGKCGMEINNGRKITGEVESMRGIEL